MAKQLKGVLGTKLGMTQVFSDEGKVVPVTVVAAGPCVVTAVRTPGADGYSAVQLGYGEIDPRRVTKPVAGHFAKAGLTPRRYLVELRTDDADQYTLGQELTAETFGAGDLVDVTGRSKGKGTAGVMKRHGFHGLGASHGTQRKHRSPGSIGGCATPGRVFKGLKMAGRMGHVRTTVPRLTVHAVDAERGLLLIKGAVPGPQGRPGPGPQRRQAARAEGGPVTSVSVDYPVRQGRQGRRAPRGDLRVRGQHPAHAPGRGGPGGGGPAGHARHQDAGHGPRRRQEALPAEGHRAGQAGLAAGAAVRRWRRRARAGAPLVRPAHAQEDEGRRAARRAVGPAAATAGSRS